MDKPEQAIAFSVFKCYERKEWVWSMIYPKKTIVHDDGFATREAAEANLEKFLAARKAWKGA